MSKAMDHLAGRVATDPLFLAHPLAEFAQSENLDDPALAARLGCRVEDLTSLRLCGAPRPDPAKFRADVAAVAGRFGLDVGVLAEAVRRGQGLARVRQEAAAAEPGVLLAARDAEPPSPPREPPR